MKIMSQDKNDSSENKFTVDKARLYPRIYRINEKEIKNYRSECSFYEIRIVEYKKDLKLYAAYCKVLNRYLTIYETQLCVSYWEKCPYRYTENIIRRSGQI
jgi:hypothetical protein